MSEVNTPSTANSLEDVLAGAMWVTALTDASLSADRLHETFMEVIFQFIPESERNEFTSNGGNTVGESDEQVQERERQLQLRTAAERERERRHKEQLRREIRELQARPEDNDNDEGHNYNSDEEEELEEEEELDDEDEFDERALNAQDQEFLDWIDATQRFPAQTSSHRTHESQPTQREELQEEHTHATSDAGRLHEENDALERIDNFSRVVQEQQQEQEEKEEQLQRESRSTAEERLMGMNAIELELGNLGLGWEEEAAAKDKLPERFRRIEQREHRPRLESKTLPGGFTYTISLEHEAYWILRQLRNAGQLLSHNTAICALANRPQHEIAHEPILSALTFALQKMTREFVEPAHLMLYHQTELHPLLHALFENSALLEASEHTLAVPSYAYCTLTGRRQRPYLSDEYVGFGIHSTRSIGEGDFAWNNSNSNNNSSRHIDFNQRKPCMIELGRLLIRILELDVLCHRLEYRRQQLLIMLQDSPESRVQDQRTLLNNIVFESIAEADVWHTFTQFLIGGRSTGAFHRIRELGLEDSYEEYTLTGLQYQENMLANHAVNVCMTPSIALMEWANQIGRTLRPTRYGENIIQLFNAAIVDQFVRLPILCKQVIDLFCSEGDLIVSHRWVCRSDDVYPLASFFVEYPRHYLELLQMERQGMIGLYYVLDVHLVRSVLNANVLYQRRARNTLEQEWNQSRESAMETLAIRLIDSLIPKVKAELHQQALYHMHMDCVQRLALLCAEGPYEATYLCLEEYSDDALTWEPAWNVVEALPRYHHHHHNNNNNSNSNNNEESRNEEYGNADTAVDEEANITQEAEEEAAHHLSLSHTHPRQLSRVCACYRGENGMTLFCFIDEHGQLLASTRWLDCAMNSSSGRATAMVQSSTLLKMFLQYSPDVLAVAASSMHSLLLMRAMRSFVVERVQVALEVAIPVVWSSCEVARFYVSSQYAEGEVGNMDNAMRMSLAVARYVQDPLQVICALFDNKRTALQMCLSGTGSAVASSLGTKFLSSITQINNNNNNNSNNNNNMSGHEHSDQLYCRLEWEMSLWMTAVGFWVEDVIHRPHSVAMLQFVSGLGSSKARVWHDHLMKAIPTSRHAMYAQLSSLFGTIVADNAISALRISCSIQMIAANSSMSRHHSDEASGLAELDSSDHINKNNNNDDAAVETWHPLDQTLIPLSWYDIASFAAEQAQSQSTIATTNTNDAPLEHSLPVIALLTFLSLNDLEKRQRIDAHANPLDLIKLIREERCEAWEQLPGERELELILEEMIALGRSFIRRPYRRISSHELMYHLTGVTYVSNEEAAMLQQQGGVGTGIGVITSANATRHGALWSSSSLLSEASSLSSSIVKEGDFVTGTVTGVRGGVLPGIRVSTSRGLRAFINALDIDDEAMRIELLEHIRHLEDIHATRMKRLSERSEQEIKLLNEHTTNYAAPEWIRGGALINGRVLRCNWNKCELLLQWSRPQDMEPFSLITNGSNSSNNKTNSAESNMLNGITSNNNTNNNINFTSEAEWNNNNYDAAPLSYANLIHDAAPASSVNSLKTVQMEREARVFSTKISRHPLFRDISNTYALEQLRDKEIGELILRPARESRSKAVCVVKVGLNCMVNWVISEERRSDGKIYYRLRDKVVEQSRTFMEIDEFLRNYIAAMVELIHNIRQHRHFTESVHEVPHALSAQEQEGYGFAYTFVESGQSARVPAYRVYTRGGGRDHSFRLHITDAFIYVRLPFRVDTSAPNVAEFKWVQCHNAEHVSETVKKHAILNS